MSTTVGAAVPTTPSPTVRDLVLRRSSGPERDRPGLLVAGGSWTWHEAGAAACVRAAVLASLLPPGEPPHVGVLLDNVPEFSFVLAGAALGGQVVVGLNPTRRGEALADDVRRADVQVVLTDAAHAPLLEHLHPDVTVLLVDAPAWGDLLAEHDGAAVPDVVVGPDTLLMLIFTSGTSGEPKAVRVTHEKVSGPGVLLAERFGLGVDDVAYLAMPMFHSNAIMAGWGVALAAGTAIALRATFSASGFIDDVRRFGATYATYVGKPLTYVMATPERADDAENPLRLVFGNEGTDRDIEGFAARFDCTVVDSYSSTENAVIVQRVPQMPAGSLGRPLDGVAVLHDDGTVTDDAVFDDDGRLTNAEAAIGQLVNTRGAGAFAGYYNAPEADAERMRGAMYWSGDLAYRDADGFVYFAGRTAEWFRVDGENLAAAPVERILLRHPAVAEAAVYAVPDPTGGDLLVAALRPATSADPLTPAGFEAFLAAQGDLSPKAWPRHVRLVEELPRTATNKVLKRMLAEEGLARGRDVWWERAPRGTTYG